MGFFDKIKRSYEDEYDLDNLEDLEDLVYNDEEYERTHPQMVLKDAYSKKKSKEHTKQISIEEKRKRLKEEEDRYDHLLNSVQAQDLINTVDRMNKEQTEKGKDTKENDHFFDEQKVDIPNVNRIPKKLETVNLDRFKGQDVENYVKEQCDIMEEAAAYMETAKEEYEIVTEHFSDIQAIEEAPEPLKLQIINVAEQVDSLTIDRRIFKSAEQKLSNSAYHHVEQYEEELPGGIHYLEKQESYYESIQRDMRMIEGERLGLRMESKQLVKRQIKIRKMALSFIFCIIMVYIIFMFAIIAAESNENMVMLLIVTGLAAVFALSMFAILKATERQVLVTEIKLNKATTLLNKAKIKYINAANILDYEYNKYKVKSAYELSKKYEAYVQMKSEQSKVLQLTSNLNMAEQELERLLKQIGLYDVHIWLSQVRALMNPKEMVEVRHGLNSQRQKLRNQINYNETRIEEAKEHIKEITVKNPEYSTYALRIIEMYEQKNRNRRS